MLIHRLISLALLLVGALALVHALTERDGLGAALFAAVAYVGFRNLSAR